MAKKLIFFLTIATAMMACTHNDGDIGDLYGVWCLEQVTVDGIPADMHAGGLVLVTLSFQNAILEINTTYPHNELHTCLANWQRDGQTLIFDFDNSDASGNTARYTPPAILGMGYGEICRQQITSLDGKEMALRYTNSKGEEYQYLYKKTK